MKLFGFGRSDERGCRDFTTGNHFSHFIEVTCSYFVLMFRRGVAMILCSELSILQLGICRHTARSIAVREVKHAVAQRMKAGQGHNLKFVAHRAELRLELRDCLAVELCFPIK